MKALDLLIGLFSARRKKDPTEPTMSRAQKQLAKAKEDLDSHFATMQQEAETRRQEWAKGNSEKERREQLRQQREAARLAEEKKMKERGAELAKLRDQRESVVVPAALPADLKRFLLGVILIRRPDMKPIVALGPPFPPKFQSLLTDAEKLFETNIRMDGCVADYLTPEEYYELSEKCGKHGDLRIWGWLSKPSPTKQRLLDQAKAELVEGLLGEQSVADVILAIQALDEGL